MIRHRVVLATLSALALAVIATPGRVGAVIDCSDAAFQNLKLPDPANPGADGWTSAGPVLKAKPPNPPESTPELAVGDQSDGTAQLFTQQVGNAQCFYLRREGIGGGTLNGVLCFDSTDCSVCAWDTSTSPPADPKGTLFSSMLFTSSYGPGSPSATEIQDCSECHVSGPAMPMAAMYQQADLIDLMNTCVSQGGPKWISAPAGWATQGPGNVVAPAAVPTTCSDTEGCHTSGFLKPQANQKKWCNFAGQAFKEGGAMASYSDDDCRSFMDALGCATYQCGPTAVPAVSSWDTWSLVAFLAAATYLALRRKPARHTL